MDPSFFIVLKLVLRYKFSIGGAVFINYPLLEEVGVWKQTLVD